MVPPSDPCSRTRKVRPAALSPNAVARPAGPPPTMATSTIPAARPFRGVTRARRSLTCTPYVVAPPLLREGAGGPGMAPPPPEHVDHGHQQRDRTAGDQHCDAGLYRLGEPGDGAPQVTQRASMPGQAVPPMQKAAFQPAQGAPEVQAGSSGPVGAVNRR